MKKFFIVVFLLIPTIVFSETITLKSGKVIEGEIVEKTDDYIKINASENVMKVRFSMMDSDSKERFQKNESLQLEPVKAIGKQDEISSIGNSKKQKKILKRVISREREQDIARKLRDGTLTQREADDVIGDMFLAAEENISDKLDNAIVEWEKKEYLRKVIPINEERYIIEGAISSHSWGEFYKNIGQMHFNAFENGKENTNYIYYNGNTKFLNFEKMADVPKNSSARITYYLNFHKENMADSIELLDQPE